jgi:hypothetical protein
MSDAYFQRLYGLTEDEYWAKSTAQGHVGEICKKTNMQAVLGHHIACLAKGEARAILTFVNRCFGRRRRFARCGPTGGSATISCRVRVGIFCGSRRH